MANLRGRAELVKRGLPRAQYRGTAFLVFLLSQIFLNWGLKTHTFKQMAALHIPLDDM